MTTGKTIALTRQTFVGKVRSVLFNMLSRLVITFLPRSSVQFSCSVMSDSLQPPWTAAPDSKLKSRDIALPTNVHLVKAMVFPVVMDVRVGP